MNKRYDKQQKLIITKKAKRKRLGFDLDQKYWLMLERIALEKDRSISYILRKIVEDGIIKVEKVNQNGLTSN